MAIGFAAKESSDVDDRDDHSVGHSYGDLALLRLRDTRTHCHEPAIGDR